MSSVPPPPIKPLQNSMSSVPPPPTKRPQNKWMIQMSPQLNDQIMAIKPELKTITKLAKCDVVYIVLSPRMQNFIRNTIGYALLFEQEVGVSTSNPNRTLANNIIIENIIYSFFGFTFNATLIIWKWLNKNGMAVLEYAIPKIKCADKRITFHARTLPQKNAMHIDDTKKLISEYYKPNSLVLIYGYCRNNERENKRIIPKELIKLVMYYFAEKQDILIIKDTTKLITEVCTPNAKLLARGYCRDKYNGNIPWYLIEIIVRFLNITLNHLHKLLRK